MKWLALFRRRNFLAYLAVDAALILYLGLWNSIVPLIISLEGTTSHLIFYESVLAIAAAIATPVLGVVVERLSRSTTLKIGCLVICISSFGRFLLLRTGYSITLLTLTDLVAVLAFAAVQPLLGVYAAENVDRQDVEASFRIQKGLKSFGRIAAPAVVSLTLLYLSMRNAMFVGALVSLCALWIALTVSSGSSQSERQARSGNTWFDDLSLGFMVCSKIPPERFFAITNFFIIALVASILPVTVPLLIKEHSLPQSTLALCISSYAAGMFVGAAVWSPFAARFLRPKSQYLWLIVVLGAALAALSAVWLPAQIAFVIFIVGAAWSSLTLVGFSKRSLAIPKGARIRVVSTNIVIAQLASTVGFVASGFIIEHAGQRWLLVWYSVVLLALVPYAFLARSPWELLGTSSDELDRFYVMRFRIASRIFQGVL